MEGWRFLLGGGRFALLEPWCAFVRERREGGKGVSEDTWCQVLVMRPRSTDTLQRAPLPSARLPQGDRI